MIKPTVGRIVLYNPGSEDPLVKVAGNHQAAIICHVWGTTCVNLAVFDSDGVPYSRTSVYLLQEGNERPPGSYAEWMPYQLGQAKKTEEVEGRLQVATKDSG